MIFAALALIVTQVPPEAPTTARTLESGTELQFVTTEQLDSRTVRQGQRFGLELAVDLVESGTVVLRRGAMAVGEIEAVGQKQMFGMSGSLVLRPLFIDVDGRRVNLEGTLSQKGSSGQGAAIPAVIVAGSLGLIITGRSARVPAGTRISARVR
ncbi:MAG: hypothetical protein ABIQ32_03115 [Sphingomicrobium sp.]